MARRVRKNVSKTPRLPDGVSPAPLSAQPQQRMGVPGGIPQQGGRANALVPAVGRSLYDGARPGGSPGNLIEDVNIDLNWYSPFQPMTPFGAPSQNYPVEWDYPVAYNLLIDQQRTALYGFLEKLSSNGEGVLRGVIEARKDQVVHMPWAIQARGAPKKKDKYIEELTEFFQSPDKQRPFTTWLRLLLEDMFTIDAACVRNWRTLGGKPYALEVIQGSTIKVLIDDAGRIPRSPQPAYQQLRKGLPFTNYSKDELLFQPRNPLPYMPIYGFSAVQQVFLRALELMNQEAYALGQWEEGSIPDLVISAPDNWCYSEDTEVLTRRGWLRFSEVDISRDDFATRDAQGRFEWQAATAINRTQYEGNLIALQSRTIDQLVTPNHRVLLTKSRDDSFRETFIRQAGELLESNTGWERIPVTSEWCGGSEVGTQSFLHEQTRGQPRNLHMTGDQFCAFMGAYLAEGSCNDRTAAIQQQPESKGFWLYYGLIADISNGLPHYSKKGAFEINCAPLADYVRQFGTATEKYIPEVIMNAPARQLELFWQFYMAGDGNVPGKQAYSSSRRLADQLQGIAQRIGRSVTLTEDDRRGREIALADGRTITTANVNYRINVSFSQVRRFEVSEQPYKGEVACVSVPNGILYVRRNGKPCWSGNSPEQIGDFQAYFDAYLSGNTKLKSRARFVPPGMKPLLAKGTTGEILAGLEKREERLARVICFAFSISPANFVSMMNRATSDNLSDEAMQEGLLPVMSYFKDNFMDPAIRQWFGYTDYEFVWLPKANVDPAKQQTILTGYVNGGIMARNEAREQLDLPPVKGGDELTVTQGAGTLTLTEVLAKKAMPPMAPGAGPNGAPAVGANGAAKPKPKPAADSPARTDREKALLAASKKKVFSNSTSSRRNWSEY